MRRPEVRAIMARRLDYCRAIGCDGVDPGGCAVLRTPCCAAAAAPFVVKAGGTAVGRASPPACGPVNAQLLRLRPAALPSTPHRQRERPRKRYGLPAGASRPAGVPAVPGGGGPRPRAGHRAEKRAGGWRGPAAAALSASCCGRGGCSCHGDCSAPSDPLSSSCRRTWCRSCTRSLTLRSARAAPRLGRGPWATAPPMRSRGSRASPFGTLNTATQG